MLHYYPVLRVPSYLYPILHRVVFAHHGASPVDNHLYLSHFPAAGRVRSRAYHRYVNRLLDAHLSNL